MNNEVLDLIICFVESYKNKTKDWNPNIHSTYNGEDYYIWNTQYLFNQIMRQINVPAERYLISRGAQELWDKLAPEGKNGTDITNYWYREKLTVHNKEPIVVKSYKGASNNYDEITLVDGKTFVFNDLFHLEHTIPVNMIIDELLKLSDDNRLNYQTVAETINKMYICRMLKSEDRSIDPQYKSKRFLDVRETIRTVYNPKIEILNFK